MQIILKYFSQVKRMNLWELLGTKDWIAHGQGKYKMGKTNTDIYMGIYIYINLPFPFLLWKQVNADTRDESQTHTGQILTADFQTKYVSHFRTMCCTLTSHEAQWMKYNRQ